jgi:hypothetical protein
MTSFANVFDIWPSVVAAFRKIHFSHFTGIVLVV